MNEIIKELIKSLGIIPEDEHYEIAELIVQDCLAVIEKRMDLGTDERCREECKALIAEIKQQYGVK